MRRKFMDIDKMKTKTAPENSNKDTSYLSLVDWKNQDGPNIYNFTWMTLTVKRSYQIYLY